MGASLANLRQYGRAIEAYTNALTLDENNVEALLGRAMAYDALGELALAEADYQRVVSIDPNNTQALFELGTFADARDELEVAVEFMSAVIDVEPENSLALAYRGSLLVDLNEWEDALEDFTQAIEFDPGNTFAIISRGYLHSFMGENQLAYEDLLNYIELSGDSENEEVLSALRELEAALDLSSDETTVIDTDDEGEAFETIIETGSITATGASEVFEIRLEAGQVLNIFMNATSGLLDPLLILQDAEGNIVAENDDDPEGGTLNAAIRDFVVPEDGVYTIIATRFQLELGTTMGDFELIIERVDSTEGVDDDESTSSTAVVEDGARISYGQIVNGEITRDTWEIRYTFEAEAGDIIGIRMARLSGTLDALVQLYDADGVFLAENDDDPLGTGRDSYLRNYGITATGVYTIVATRFQGQIGTTTGTFELEVLLVGD